MNKTLITLGVVAAVAMPVAAFAHTNLSIGLGLGGPVYAPPPAVVYEQPAPVYVEPPVVYEQPAYVYGPPVVYGPTAVYQGYYGPRYYRPYGYRHY
ncbi:MAG: hypothetical protein JWR16_2202 [Nevskia sp.]|nr:hypothetical protein [Nevskia sp.]